jgi:hypothetical protein
LPLAPRLDRNLAENLDDQIPVLFRHPRQHGRLPSADTPSITPPLALESHKNAGQESRPQSLRIQLWAAPESPTVQAIALPMERLHLDTKGFTL